MEKNDFERLKSSSGKSEMTLLTIQYISSDKQIQQDDNFVTLS